MPLINYDDNALAIMGNANFVAPKSEDYERSNMGALFTSMNTGAALKERGDFERLAVDISRYENVEFNRQNLESQLKEQGYSADIINDMLTSSLDDWTDVERRARYFKAKEQREQQLAENFTTAEMLLYGLPMALVDIDAPVGGAIFKGARAINKSRNFGKSGTIATNAGAAGVFGAASMTGYEAVSGDYQEGSTINAFLIGSALGGGLGLLTAKTDAQSVFSKVSDELGNELGDKEAKVTQMSAARERFEAVDAVINKVQEARAAIKGAKKELPALQEKDKALARVDLDKSRSSVQSSVDYLQGVVQNAKQRFDNARTVSTAKRKELDELKTTLQRGEESSIKFGRDRAEMSRLIAERAPVKKRFNDLELKITSLEAKLQKAKAGRDSAGDAASRKPFRDKITKLNAELRPLKQNRTKLRADLRKADAAVKLVEKQVAKYDPKTVNTIREGLPQIPRLQKEIEDLQKAEDDAFGKLDNEQTRLKVARDTLKGKTQKNAYNNLTESLDTRNLKKILADNEKTLSEEGLQQLIKEKQVLADDLAKMEEGDFNIKNLYGIRKEARTAFEKLRDELNDVARLDTLENSAVERRVPQWARKLLISPISRLLNSDNALVSGFATYLHSGTLNQGKIRPMTAWIVRQTMDVQLDRAHKAITYEFQQAVKEGYRGTLKQFEASVAQNIHAVNGRIQRQLLTETDGLLTYEERLERALQNSGSVQRIHSSGNKHIDNAVNATLDYYEQIFQRGSKVDLAAFKGVLGKGYSKRLYSADKINRLGKDKSIKLLTDAQYAYAVDTKKPLTAETMAEFKANATAAVEAALGLGYKRGEVTKPLGFSRKGAEASLRQRSIEAFDDDIADLLDDDIRATTSAYGVQTHGRIALKEKIGADTDDQVEDMIQQLGATDKEVDLLRTVVETIRGHREISKNPNQPVTRALKGLSSISSAMQIMGFGLTTTTEISALAKDFGWRRSISQLVGNPKEIVKMYKYGTPSEKNTIELMVGYSDANFNQRANRFDVETGWDSVGKLQEWLDTVNARGAVYGGLLPITDMLRMTSASLTVDFLARMSVAKKISNADLKRLEDIGWTPDMLPRIKKTLRVDDTGRILNTDRATWGKLDEEITASVMTNVERTILHPNAATLPMFMTDMDAGQIVPRLLMKFMRFPIESYERLLLRGMQEADAKQLMAVVGNVAMWTAVLSMRDAMRDPEKQMYVGEEGTTQLFIDSLIHNSVTSSIPAGLDLLSGLTTGENLTNDYTFRVGGAPQAAYETLLQGKVRANIFGYSAQADLGSGAASIANTLFKLEDFNEDL